MPLTKKSTACLFIAIHFMFNFRHNYKPTYGKESKKGS